jgi:chromosome segregation protein
VLRLKRVELQGFKSFCDRSEMRFHGTGVAAIVGPNGCGKSNLSDAISWVLGEQSAKTLRGSRMEDVIFAGTRDRKPVSMASVTMTLVDPAVHADFPAVNRQANGLNGHSEHKQPEHKPEEITITRRLFRSGDSEYLINGKTARLRDIQDLFMGSGLGPESYAIIEQGRIGQILSTKPQDRRAVIEEAAGITRFKTKKRLAEAKLESAKANLARVFDILEEVSRQVNSLKRQAAKAKRYGELKAEMIAQLRIALTGRFRMLEREAAKTALEVNAAAAELQELNADVAGREKEYTALQEACYLIEARLTEARKDLAEKRVEAERVRGRLESQAREISTIEQRLTRGEAEAQDLDKRFEQQQLELSGFAQRLAGLEQQAEQSRVALTAKTGERDALQHDLRERERSMESSRQQVLRLLGEASTLKNQLAQIDQYLLGLNRDTERIQRDESAAMADLGRLEGLKAELSERQSARQLELQSTADQRRDVEEELAVRKDRAGEARRKLEELRNVASNMKARKDSLEEILSHRAYTTESVKRLFTAIEQGQAQELEPAGVLADFVEVDPTYEKAAEEFLHEELEYVVVKDWEQAERGIAFMRSDMDGRATFLVHPEPDGNVGSIAAAPEPALGPESGVVARLSDRLRFTNGLSGARVELLPRLARCFIVEDRTAAQHLALQYPDIYFLLPDGVCYHGRAVSGGKKTGSGPLGLKRELREITGHWQNRQKELDETRSLLEGLEVEISQLTEELERLRALQQKQEKDALALDHEMRKMAEEFSRANSRLSVARMELQRLQTEGANARERRDSSIQLVAEKERARGEQEQALAEARHALERLQRDTARIAEEHSALRVELAGLEERRRAEENAQQRIENQVREMAHRRQQLTQEMDRLGLDRTRLLSDNIELDGRASILAQQISAGAASVEALALEESKGRADLAVSDEQIKLVRNSVQAAHEKRSQIELELVKKQAELKYLDETCRKELNAGLEEIAAGSESEIDEIGLADAEQRHQDLRSRIEALGPVNPQALEEFEEAQQRYDFLNTQRQDLLDSIRDTEKAIHEIDIESRKRFSEAFEAINANFREMFKTLFGGGIGEMRLSDLENSADSGIDIVASPPGKKLQSVLLLSGGERALTAMALLMAIFKYQPSPFCVLDEVDAPLDEANIERLTKLIREMSHQTQFVVITHAKRTMEAAQALYGVTMQEPGVSKLVSVKIDPPPPPPPPSYMPQLATV